VLLLKSCHITSILYTLSTVIITERIRNKNMAVFGLFKKAAVRHLEFVKVRNFSNLSDRESQYASPCQIMCRSVELLGRYGRFSICQDGGRSPSWICFKCIWTTHEKFVGLCHCAKFGWNRCSGFDNIPVVMFCEFGLKMRIHALFGWFLGDLTP